MNFDETTIPAIPKYLTMEETKYQFRLAIIEAHRLCTTLEVIEASLAKLEEEAGQKDPETLASELQERKDLVTKWEASRSPMPKAILGIF